MDAPCWRQFNARSQQVWPQPGTNRGQDRGSKAHVPNPLSQDTSYGLAGALVWVSCDQASPSVRAKNKGTIKKAASMGLVWPHFGTPTRVPLK